MKPLLHKTKYAARIQSAKKAANDQPLHSKCRPKIVKQKPVLETYLDKRIIDALQFDAARIFEESYIKGFIGIFPSIRFQYGEMRLASGGGNKPFMELTEQQAHYEGVYKGALSVLESLPDGKEITKVIKHVVCRDEYLSGLIKRKTMTYYRYHKECAQLRAYLIIGLEELAHHFGMKNRRTQKFDRHQYQSYTVN